MSNRDTKARELCEAGLKLMWQGEAEAALDHYGRAMELTSNDELREMLTIRRAEAFLALDREAPEISMLAQIVMRRRTPRHVYLAALALMRRYVESDDLRRGIFYGEIGRKAAEELGDPMARASILNGLGISLAASSDFSASLDALEEAYDALELIDENRADVRSLRPVIIANIGGVNVSSGETERGITLLEDALPFLDEDYAIAEAMLDLSLGYHDLENYEAAEAFAARALTLSTVDRQVRNANYLLGRIATAQGRYPEAADYFDVVAGFYPEFPNVKELLLKVDLSKVVNWKA
jgi:tetratricopeptide (TPR) repeat protein